MPSAITVLPSALPRLMMARTISASWLAFIMWLTNERSTLRLEIGSVDR